MSELQPTEKAMLLNQWSYCTVQYILTYFEPALQFGYLTSWIKVTKLKAKVACIRNNRLFPQYIYV